MQDLRENREKLNGCPWPHRFERVPGSRLRATFRCTECGGYADVRDVELFLQGVRAGRAVERRELADVAMADGAPLR